LVLAIFSTWTQVTAPDLIGQTVDCYLTPYTQQKVEGMQQQEQAAVNNCWFNDHKTGSISRSETVSGVQKIILLLLALFISGAVANGLQFYLIRKAGLYVLRDLRVDVFRHVHRLSLDYYAKNEAGDVMSRITNDMETLQQALNFALVQVVRGSLLIIWLIYVMCRKNVPFALISMTTVPLMALATVWFSNQARKAFRQARLEIGSVKLKHSPARMKISRVSANPTPPIAMQISKRSRSPAH
jgi:ATP-binding cassette subfamily B multidrug efflux pump